MNLLKPNSESVNCKISPTRLKITRSGRFSIKDDRFRRIISEFDRKFRDCMDRRKRYSTYMAIQNIIMPCQFKNEMGELREKIYSKKLLNKLLAVIGTQKDIKLRQRLFMVQNFVNRYGDEDSIALFTGSLTDGVVIKGSDEDEMIVLKFVRVLRKEEAILDHWTDVWMDTTGVQPGFAKLTLLTHTPKNRYINNSLVENTCIISSSKFRDQFIEPGSVPHGPCSAYPDGTYDFAMCLFGPHWPDKAEPWIWRSRKSNWPSKKLISDIVKDGCFLVPIGPRHDNDELLWRISFSIAEKRLMFSLNHTQILCYGLLKIILKELVENEKYLKGDLCSYYLKTAIFWVSEEFPEMFWNYENLLKCFHACIEKLIEWVQRCFCPNYFIPENNMFYGKRSITPKNNLPLLAVLCEIRREGYKVFCRCPTLSNFLTPNIMSNEQREVESDLLALRAIHSYPFDSLFIAYKSLLSVHNLVKSEKCSFIKDVCKYFEAVVCKQIPQLLDENKFGCNKEVYKKRKLDKQFSLCGASTDFGSGWLMFASYLYNQREYKNVLFIVEYVLLGVKPGMISLRNPSYTEDERRRYRETVCGRNMTLAQKLKLMTFNFVQFNDKSQLIPSEFTPEANIRPVLMAPAIVYSHCLEFLCHYHLKDHEKQKKALCEIETTIRERKWVKERAVSQSLTLLGVCFQVYGDLDMATKFYIEARDTIPVCKSVYKRLENLMKA